MDFENTAEMERVYHYAQRRAADVLQHLYDEPDPMLDVDEIAQTAVVKLWRDSHGKDIQSPRQWASQAAYWTALKAQRIGFHGPNRQAGRWLDIYLDDFIAEHHRLPTEAERAELAAEVNAEMRRDRSSKDVPQPEFDQIRQMEFYDDDEVRDELDCIASQPSCDGPIEGTSLYAALADRAMERAEYLATKRTFYLPQVTELVLTHLARGYDLDKMGHSVLRLAHIAEHLGRSRHGLRAVLDQAKNIVREVTSELTAP